MNTKFDSSKFAANLKRIQERDPELALNIRTLLRRIDLINDYQDHERALRALYNLTELLTTNP